MKMTIRSDVVMGPRSRKHPTREAPTRLPPAHPRSPSFPSTCPSRLVPTGSRAPSRARAAAVSRVSAPPRASPRLGSRRDFVPPEQRAPVRNPGSSSTSPRALPPGASSPRRRERPDAGAPRAPHVGSARGPRANASLRRAVGRASATSFRAIDARRPGIGRKHGSIQHYFSRRRVDASRESRVASRALGIASPYSPPLVARLRSAPVFR